MKLTALRLHNVKRFGGHGIAIEGIGDGVNVLTAANEFGKSTAFEALHALFFQAHTGTSRPVQLLRPYSGGNPLIEADIETTSGQYRLTKQFYGNRRAEVRDLASGRLLQQADEAEAFISDLTRGGSAGPAGLLWVRQGITGIEERSTRERESEQRVRESLLTSVQGEVEALTGGRRMAEIAAACEEEQGKLVTDTGRPKANGKYALAIAERDRLLAEEVRLRDDVSALRDALDQRRAARTRLAELERPEEVAARRAAISEAEMAFETARTQSEALKVAEAEAALAGNRHGTAATALDEFGRAIDQARKLGEKLAEARARRSASLERRSAVVTESDNAHLAVNASELEEREQRDLLTRLNAALHARDAAERLIRLRSQLEKAEAAREGVEQGEAALAMLAVPATSITQLQALELELAGLHAAQKASLPTVRIDYESRAEGDVTVSGNPMAGGEEISFARVLRLDIAGVGALTLRSNRPPQADSGVEQATARRNAILAALGVETLAAALQRQAEAQQKASDVDLARQRLTDLAPQGIAELQTEIAKLVEISAGDLELKGDPEDVGRALAAAAEQVSTNRNTIRELQVGLNQASNAVVEAEKAVAALAGELASLDAILGPVTERYGRQASLATDEVDLRGKLAEAESRVAALGGVAADLVATEASLRRLRSVESAAIIEAGHLRETLADLNGNINARSDAAVEEIWEETKALLAAASDAVDRTKTEVDVLTRLRLSLTTARSAARDLYLKPVITELRPLLRLLFDDISIVFDEETLLPQTVIRNGREEEVDRLSGGMREQLSVLTRLAFARLLARDGRPAPVILDDALVYSDDDRIERMFDALHQQANGQQILVFSCRQRAFAKLGGNVLRMQPWEPARA